MRAQELLPSEIARTGSYDFLEMEQAKLNLSEFENFVYYCQGYVPESFLKFDGPNNVHWLHIDINAAKATVDILGHFWERIPSGGVILFDDYDWPGYEDTKRMADTFALENSNWILALPTGQGLLVKN